MTSLSPKEAALKQLTEDFTKLVEELKTHNLSQLAEALSDPRVTVNYKPSSAPLRVRWSYGSIRNRYSVSVVGSIPLQAHETALWETALALFRMRNYQGLFQRSSPLWMRDKDLAAPTLTHQQLSDREIELVIATQPEFMIEDWLVGYPARRRDAQLEDMATVDTALYALYNELSGRGAKLEIFEKDPARSPKLSVAKALFFSWFGYFSNSHRVNARDLNANLDAEGLQTVLRKRFGWRLFVNWHEINFARAIIFSAIIMLPVHVYEARNFAAYFNAAPQFVASVNNRIEKNDVILSQKILAQYDDHESTQEDREDALDALGAVYQSDPETFKSSRVEMLIKTYRSSYLIPPELAKK